MLPTERYAERTQKTNNKKYYVLFKFDPHHFDQPLNTSKKEYISVLSMLHSVSRKEHIV